jgi:hypothetical protein
MLDGLIGGILDQANPRQGSLTECRVACPHPLDLRPGSGSPEAKKLRGVAFERPPTKVFSRLRRRPTGDRFRRAMCARCPVAVDRAFTSSSHTVGWQTPVTSLVWVGCPPIA